MLGHTMNILLINGSPKGEEASNSHQMLESESLRQHASRGMFVEQLNIAMDIKIRGCFHCWKKRLAEVFMSGDESRHQKLG